MLRFAAWVEQVVRQFAKRRVTGSAATGGLEKQYSIMIDGAEQRVAAVY